MANIIGITPPPARDPAYVTKINNSLTAIDNHDHSDGKGVPVARVASGAVGTLQIADGSVTEPKIANAAVTSNKIANNAVTTDRIADGAVTKEKQSALGQQESSSCGVATISSNIGEDVNNLSVNITTFGRPVIAMLLPVFPGSGELFLEEINGSLSMKGTVSLERVGSGTNQTFLFERIVNAGGISTKFPLNCPIFFDSPPAGNHEYKISASTSGTATDYSINFIALKLVVFEL